MHNHSIKGATDLYEQMVEIVSDKRGCLGFSKKQASELKIEWSFVEKSAEILNLKIVHAGRYGYLISK